MKKLPTKPQYLAPLDEERFATVTTMAFFCGDVTYQMMHESCNLLLRDRKDLKHDVKYRYNQFIEAMDRARKAALAVGGDVMGLSEKQIEYFFDDSDYIKNIMCLIYDKTKHNNGDNAERILKFLKEL